MLTGRESEFRYLLHACLGGNIEPPVIDASFNWRLLREMATRHRVDGLLWQHLTANPEVGVSADFMEELDRSSRAQSFAYLAQLAETLRLSDLLKENGHPVISLKGCGLGHQLYAPQPHVRQSQDIDLLVAQHNFAAAGDILSREGYERTTPGSGMPQSADSMARHLTNAFEFYHPVKRLKVELHHRLLLDPYLMPVPFQDLLARATVRRIGNGELHCLGPADLPVYLCCHAADDAFFRLKWLADMGRLFDCSDADAIGGMMEHARLLGATRHVLLTLMMLEDLSGRPMPALEAKVRQDLTRLAAQARWAILREDRGAARYRFVDIPDDLRLLAYGIRLNQVWRSRGFKVLRHLSNHDDMSTLKLGVEWRLLYALLGRPLALRRWLGRTLTTRGTSPA